jgi:hypothetical protein
MNNIKFNQAGGFPLSTNILDEVQSSYTPILNGIGAMAGSLAILSGCVESGATITNGVVQIGSEILEFRGGIKQTNVVIVEEVTPYEFEDGQTKNVVFKRYATFGSGTQNYAWEDFQRVISLGSIGGLLSDFQTRLATLEAVSLPILQGDGLVLFNNTADKVPPGFDEVPEEEWRNRTPVHINRSDPNFDEVGKIGGEKSHMLTVDELPDHYHLQGSEGLYNNFDGGEYVGDRTYPPANLPAYNNQRTSSKPSERQTQIAMPMLPPYRVIIYIRFVGLGKGMNG